MLSASGNLFKCHEEVLTFSPHYRGMLRRSSRVKIFLLKTVGFLPDILPLSQAPVFVWFDGTITEPVFYYHPFRASSNYVLHVNVWWLCMAITTMFDDVLWVHCFCFVFAFCLVSLHGDSCKCTA